MKRKGTIGFHSFFAFGAEKANPPPALHALFDAYPSMIGRISELEILLHGTAATMASERRFVRRLLDHIVKHRAVKKLLGNDDDLNSIAIREL